MRSDSTRARQRALAEQRKARSKDTLPAEGNHSISPLFCPCLPPTCCLQLCCRQGRCSKRCYGAWANEWKLVQPRTSPGLIRTCLVCILLQLKPGGLRNGPILQLPLPYPCRNYMQGCVVPAEWGVHPITKSSNTAPSCFSQNLPALHHLQAGIICTPEL